MTLLSLMLCLILSSGGCVSAPPTAIEFEGKWTFYQPVSGEPYQACLQESDVDALREILIRCGTK